jgi:dihydroorotate dehydrogenase
LLRAGASLVQVYTSFIYEGPGLAARINRGLLRGMERADVARIGEIGGARTRCRSGAKAKERGG